MIAFEVSKDLPEDLQVGWLVPGARYDGIARFSRSQSKHADDSSLDQRGFAFRIDTDEGPAGLHALQHAGLQRDTPEHAEKTGPDYLTTHLAGQLRQGERRFTLNTQF